jgi:fucose permease
MKLNRLSRTMIFYAASFFQGFCLIIIPAASAILKSSEFGALTDRQYGLSFLPMNLSAVLITISFNRLLQRFGRQALLNAGLLGLGGYTAAVWGASCGVENPVVFAWLLCANLCLGIGFGLLISVANLAMVELYPEKRDVFLMGMHGFLGIGAALAPLSVEFFYAKGFWPMSHGLYLGVWVGLALLIALTRPADYCRGETAEVSSCSLDESSAFRMPRSAWLFLGAIFIYGVAESITGNWSTLYLTGQKGFSFQTAARALSTFWIFLTVGRILAAFAALRMDVRILYRLSPVGITAALWTLLVIRQEFLVVPVYAAIGFSCSYFFPLSIGISTQYHSRFKDTLSSFGIAAIMAGVSVGTTLMGLLQDSGRVEISKTFMVAALCAAMLILVTLGLTRPKLPESQA